MEPGPGFTGATLDRADALRTNDEKLAAARADPRARLLGLNGLEPLIAGDGGLLWKPMPEAAAASELVLLGLDGEEPRFAELRLGDADTVNRSMAIAMGKGVTTTSSSSPWRPPLAPSWRRSPRDSAPTRGASCNLK